MSDASREQALRLAMMRRANAWRAAAARAQRLGAGRAVDLADAMQAVDDYRNLAHDLSAARRLMPTSRAREYLESAYSMAHATLHRSASHPLAALRTLFRDEIPRTVYGMRWQILWVTVLFVSAAVAGYALIAAHPDVIGLFASPDMIARVERGELWTEGLLNIAPSSVLSARIFTNNIVVSLTSFCVGILFGLGTFYMVGLNGLMLGAVFAFTAQHGLAGRLFQFVVAHGCVEISVLCLSGAAGAAVGEALIRPGESSRAQAFQAASLKAAKLLALCVALLVGCGLIEGYVSPNPDFPLWTRIVVGLGYWTLMLALLRGWLFART